MNTLNRYITDDNPSEQAEGLSLDRYTQADTQLTQQIQPQREVGLYSGLKDFMPNAPDWAVNALDWYIRTGSNLATGLGDTMLRGMINIPALTWRGIGIPIDYLTGGKSLFTRAADWANDLDETYTGYSNSYRDFVNNKNPSLWDEGVHGLGTSLGYMALGGIAGEKAAAAGLSKGLSTLIGYGVKNASEALTEAANTSSELYSQDKNRGNDAFLGGMYSLATNGPLDLLHAGVGGVLETLMNVALPTNVGGYWQQVAREGLKNLIGEEIDENFQEPRQQAIEQAVKKTFASGDMSFDNFYNNLKTEGGHIFSSFKDENGNEIPSYIAQTAPATTLSTLLTTAVLAPFRIPAGGFTTQEQLKRMSREAGEAEYTELKRMRDDIQSHVSNLQSRLDEEYKMFGADIDIDRETSSRISTMEQELHKAEQNLAAYNREIENFWGDTGMFDSSNAVQDDAGMDLLADIRDNKQQESQITDNAQTTTTPDIPQEQNIPQIIDIDEIHNPYREDSGEDMQNNAQSTPPDLIPDSRDMQDNTDTLLHDLGLNIDNSATYDDNIDDEPDGMLDEDFDEQYKQLTPETYYQLNSTQDSHNNDGSRNIGTFVFSVADKDYALDVVSSTPTIHSDSNLYERRMARWNGTPILVKTKSGNVIATYLPYRNEFSFSTDFDKKHSTAWKQKFQHDFMVNLQSYLNNGGFIDDDGLLRPDGNEGFRKRWENRRNNHSSISDFYSSFTSNELQQEDFDTPSVAKLNISFQNKQGREVSSELSIQIGSFGDDMPAQQRFYGRYLNILDSRGRLIARYSPRTNMIKFTNNGEAQAMKNSVMDKLKHQVKSILRNSGFLDENGKLIPDGNENYRTARKYAHDIPGSMLNNTQSIQQLTPLGQNKNTARVRTIKGTEVEVRYNVAEADDLITSTNDNGGINQYYPQELQPRQRNRQASFEQIVGIASHIDPELLGENRLASDGAPVIGSDYVVESGNGRVMALRRAYRYGTADNYRTWLIHNATRFGLNPHDISNMRNPVLVRERISDVDRVKFTQEANQSSTSHMSMTENALNDARNITPDMLALYDSERTLQGNSNFIRAFTSIVPQSERADFLQKDGKISKSGLDRIMNALFAKAYKDSAILNRLNEIYDDDIKNVSNALIQAAPKLAILENGGYPTRLSISDDIAKAVAVLAQLKQDGESVADFMSQIRLFDDISPEAKTLLKVFDANKRSSKRIAQILIGYAENAMNEPKEGQGLMFDVSRNKSDILAEAIRHSDDKNKSKISAGNNSSETYNQQQSWFSKASDFVTGFLGKNSSDSGNMSAIQESTSAKPQHTSKIHYRDNNGKNHTLTLNTGEFNEKYSNERQYFGRYMEYTDENGNVVARFSPYTKILQVADNVQDSDSLRNAIMQDYQRHGRSLLQNFGYLDEYGRLLDDGNEEFRHKYRTREDTTPKGKNTHADNLNSALTNKRKDSRSLLRRIKDTWHEREKYETVRLDVKQAIHHQLDKISQAQELDGRLKAKLDAEKAGKNYTEPLELTNEDKERIHHDTEFIAEQYSHVITARINAAAHLAGMSVEDYHKLWNLRILADIGEDTDSRGNVEFKHAKLKDGVLQQAETIIHLTQSANASTVLHEFAHIFLRDYQDLIASVHDLPSIVKKDWLYLTRWLGISDIDPHFIAPKSYTDNNSGEEKLVVIEGVTRTEEQQARYTNAQEKFAVAFEQYYMTGKAPKSRLQRVFNYFKQWMTSIYGAIRNIKYAGSDGHMHEVELSPQVKRIFDRMLNGSSYYVPSYEGRKARTERAGNSQGEGFYNQTVNGQNRDTTRSKLQGNSEIFHQNQANGDSKSWENTVDRFINGEISRSKDGNLLHVMDSPAVFSLVGMDRLPVEIRIDNMRKVLFRKHHISPDTLKQIPQALADPIMIFKSEHDTSRERDSRIIFTELKEMDNSGKERSVMAAITIGKNNLSKGYAINELTTVYKKDTTSKQNLTPDEDIYDWINKKFKDGSPMNLLLYVNKQKARQGAISSGLKPIVFDTLNGLPDSIPDEHNLARLNSQQKQDNYEQYHQIIGISGARRLDEHYGNHTLMDNLKVARKMERKGLPVKKMWAATGWMRGADRKWRYEMPDGNIIRKKIDSQRKIAEQFYNLGKDMMDNPNFDLTPEVEKRYNELENLSFIKLHEVFDAPELFTAYPALRDVQVFIDHYTNASAIYYPDMNSIGIGASDSNFSVPRELRKSLIHEIQHAIQTIEGFAEGSSYSAKHDATYNKYYTKFKRIMNNLDEDANNKIADILQAERDGHHDKASALIHALSDDELLSYNSARDALRMAETRSKFLFSKYMRHAGETEARNSETRAYWGEKRRRNTTLDKSEDVPRSEQIVGRIHKKATSPRINRSNDSFISQDDIERFKQLALHGTGHIILNNKFNLEYIGTGDGSQVYGWGLYFAQNPKVAEFYKSFGRNISILNENGQHVSGSVEAIQLLKDYLSSYSKKELKNFNSVKNKNIAFCSRFIQNMTEELREERGYVPNEQILSMEHNIAIHKEIIRILQEQATSFNANDGNVYKVDIPENDTLLDWDSEIQPEKVQKAIQKVIAKLEKWNVSPEVIEKINNAKNGEEFYHTLEQAMQPFVNKGRVNSKKLGTISRSDMAASLLLNQAGVPGLRYWDSDSSKNKQGTHNFVIWNTDMIKMLGLTDDSDDEAKQYFRDTAKLNQRESSETYSQISCIERTKDFIEGKNKNENNSNFAFRSSDSSFTTDKDIELFYQGSFHATPHIILNNEFDFSKIGTGEGIQAFGFGFYTSQERLVGEVYRRALLPPSRRGRLHLFTNYGKEVNFPMTKMSAWADTNAAAMLHVWEDLNKIIPYGSAPSEHTFAKVKKLLINYYYKKGKKDKAKALNSIKRVYRDVLSIGNLYTVEVPENDVLLNWNAPLSKQPIKVKRAMKAIVKKLRELGIELQIDKANTRNFTGGDFYNALVNTFSNILNKRKIFVKSTNISLKPDMAASMLFNRHGVPGNRHLNKFGREKGIESYNFVIWNKDFLKITGIIEDSDKEAVDYFRNTILQKLTGNQNETYHQIIGQKGALQLDKKNGNSWLEDNLGIAKAMNRAGKSPNAIRLATGWELGNDNEWKYEIMDGNIDFNALWQAFKNNNEELPFSMKLKKLYLNHELFNAYPQLKELPVDFSDKLPQGTHGVYFHNDTKSNRRIEIDAIRNIDNIQSTLIHEIQHAIQFIEGFAEGGKGQDALVEGDVAMSIALERLHYLLENYSSNVKNAAQLYDKGFARKAEKLVSSFSQNEKLQWKKIKHILDSLHDGQFRFDTYSYLGGEIEARNAQYRENFSPEQRKNTLLADSQDSQNWLINKNGSPQNYSIVQDYYNSYESFNQSVSQAIQSYDHSFLSDEAISQIHDVRKKFEGTDKWLKAPNGNNTNLTELQWLFVRTPNFKQWFGDWEAAHIVQKVRDFLENSEPVGSISGNEFLKSDIVQGETFAKHVADYYKKTGNSIVTNKELGDVKLDIRGVKDSLGHGLGREKVAAFALVPDVIRNGFIYDRQNNWKGRNYNTATLIANVKIGGKDYVCEVVVKQSENKQGFYLHEVEVKENLDGVFRTALNDGTPSRSRLIISQYADEAHNSSKVVDENGEPLVVTHISRGNGGFSVFNTNGDFSSDGDKTYGTGAWFADFKGNEHISLETAGIDNPIEGKNIFHVFLNLRNPYIYDAEGKRWQRVGKVWIEDTKNGKLIYHNLDGKPFSNLSWAHGFIEKHLDPKNLEPDRYIVKHETRFQTSDELVRAVRQGFIGNGHHDGVIIRNLRDMSVWGVDDYVVFSPNSIKSVTRNNGMFSESVDIYKQTAHIQNEKINSELHSSLSKYSDILKRANNETVIPDNLLDGTHGFTTHDILEKYKQLNTQPATHATGHIILNNHLALNFIGTGEGGAAYGAGIYLEQSPEVAQHYRKYGIPNMGRGTLHVYTLDGISYSASDKDKWTNSPDDAIREALNFILSYAVIDPESSLEEIKGNLTANIKFLEIEGEKTDKYKNALKFLDSISHWAFSPDDNSRKKGNIYNALIPENEVLLNWDALLDEQPKHVKKAIDKINDFIYAFAQDYEIDIDEARDTARSEGWLTNSGGEFYNFISEVMRRYLDEYAPDDGITDPQMRASLLFLRFGIPGHRYWDGLSRNDIYKRYKEYRNNNPLSNGREAFSVAKTADGREFVSQSDAWITSWSNNPDKALNYVLTDFHRIFSSYGGELPSIQDVKNELLDKYHLEVKRANEGRKYGYSDDEIHDEINKINAKIEALLSIASFSFYPRIKPEPYSPFSKFPNEGTRDFVIWDESLIQLVGLTPDSDKEAIEYFNKYKNEHNDGFITPDAVEKLNQIVTHATGNIIWNNRFDLRYAGSSEGGAAFGFGAYFEQNQDVAQKYRRYALPKGSEGIIHIFTKNGLEFIGNDFSAAEDNPLMLATLNDVYEAIRHYPHWEWDSIKASIKERYKSSIDSQRRAAHTTKNNGISKSLAKKYIESFSHKLHLLDSITGFNFEGRMRGNIYQFDIPEDFELLDWDAPLDTQPENVLKAIKKIFAALKRKGFSLNDILSNHALSSANGENLYEGIVHAFEHMDSLDKDLFNLKKKGISRPDARASWLFNKYGIPGLRYWDGISRDKKSGTHNFVIWNMDKVTMTGISDDSDDFARKTFYNAGKQQLSIPFDEKNETYNQHISEKATERLSSSGSMSITNTMEGSHSLNANSNGSNKKSLLATSKNTLNNAQDSDIYKQAAHLQDNPLLETYSQFHTFDDSHTEAAYRKYQSQSSHSSTAQNIRLAFQELAHGFKGDFPLLAGNEAKQKGLTAAREILRFMNRNSDAKTHITLNSLYDSLHKLSSEQYNIFSRLMLLHDIKNFALSNPAKSEQITIDSSNPPSRENLPLGFDSQSLDAEYKKFLALAKKDKDILLAIQTEHNNNVKAKNDLIRIAQSLGFISLAKRLMSHDFFLLQYADLLSGNDINANYVIATAERRTTLLQDFERLQAIQKLKAKGYDKKAELVNKFGNEWKLHVPKGYSIFNPLSGQFIQSAHSLTDNILGLALEEAGKKLGLSDKTMSNLRAKLNDKMGTQLMVLPNEITHTLLKLSVPNKRNPLSELAKALTTAWKKYILYFPTRAWKYNIRNITGDLDAVLAGNPTALRFLPQSLKELFTAYYGDIDNVSKELKEFQARGGALTLQSAQELGDYKQFKQFNDLIAQLDGNDSSAWKKLPHSAWNFIWNGIQKISDFRE